MTLFTQKGAEELAVQGFEYMGANPSHLAAFLNESGLAPQDLREVAAKPHFLKAVMQFIISNENLLLDFANAKQLNPQDIAGAARQLGCHFE